MIKIAITQAAFEALAATLPLGSVGYENEINERGELFAARLAAVLYAERPRLLESGEIEREIGQLRVAVLRHQARDGVTASTSTGRARAFVVAVLCGVVVAGCAANPFVPGGPTWSIWKEGTTRAQRMADYADCKLEAIREVPTAVGVGSTPGFSSPGSVLCNGLGNMVTCNTVGGYNNPGSVYSYDASARTRQQYVAACLIKKGYVRKQTTFCQDPNDMTTEDCVVPTGL